MQPHPAGLRYRTKAEPRAFVRAVQSADTGDWTVTAEDGTVRVVLAEVFAATYERHHQRLAS